MAVARQGAATATAFPARFARPTNSRSYRLCSAKAVDGWRCLAGWRLHCSRSCCARHLRTSQRRRIRSPWRLNQSHLPPMRTQSSPLRPSTSLHLASSTRTPSWMRRKCRPRRPPNLPAPGTEHQPAKKAAHHTSARTVRKTHAFADRGSPFVIYGVLTPPEPTAWHGAGY